MQSHPLITVITLSYHSTYLFEAIRSVLSQSYPCIQYIIADDGTEGFEPSAIEEYIEKNNRGNIKQLQILTHEKNMGTVINYNRALREAMGEYIFPLSADDLYVHNRVLEEWTDQFIAGGYQVMCAYCDNYDESMRTFQGRWPRPDHAKLLQSKDCGQIYKAMERVKLLPGCTMARTRNSLKTLGYFDESYRLLEDYPFVMRLLRGGTSIGFWAQSAVKRRRCGVSDRAKQHPQLIKDMERFYQEEVFPYCDDLEGLNYYLKKNKEETERIVRFEEVWDTGTFFKRAMISLKMPKQFMRKMYHSILKI